MVRYGFAAAVLLFVGLTGCSGDGAIAQGTPVPAPAMADPARGRLLYETACAACHTEQAHWREKSVVHDWPSLLYQVTRWQANAGQNWRAEEIEDVAAYLNRRFYHMPCPLPGCAADKVGVAPPAVVVVK